MTAPQAAEKRTLPPKPESLLLDRDILSIESEKQKLTIKIGNQPEAMAYVDSLRGLMNGKPAELEEN